MTETVRTLADRRREAVKKDIATTAALLFTTRGFDATSVLDIADAAGISVRTFYRHCPTKEDALTPVLVSGIRHFVEYLDGRPEDEVVSDSVHQAFVQAFNRYRNAADVTPKELFVVLTSVPGIHARWMVAAHELAGDMRPLLARRAGLTPDGLSARMLSHTLISALTVTLEYWATDDHVDADDIGELAASALAALSLIAPE